MDTLSVKKTKGNGKQEDKLNSSLQRIKKNVENSYNIFSPNYQSFKKYIRYVFDTTLDADDLSILRELQKPQLEFNIMRSHISRLMGEFSNHQPDITVTRDPGVKSDEISAETISILENHFRHSLEEADKNSFQFTSMQQILAGGFTAGKVWTEYENAYSFDQVIKFDTVYDPTLAFWDPLARKPHKGDGRYCGFIHPMTEKEFKAKYPGININDIKYSYNVSNFSWAYDNTNEKIILVCEYYEKREINFTLVSLADGQAMSDAEYKEFLKEWELSGNFMVPPAVTDKRKSTKTVIDRYVFIEDKVISYDETEFSLLPVPFGDGDSHWIDRGSNGTIQVTTPYAKDLVGAQKLKNLAGQSLANEIEMISQQKIKAAKEGIPNEPDYLRGYTQPQLPSVLVYNAYKENDPDHPLPPPQEIQRQPIPQEILLAFSGADQTAQVITGSYDAEMGMQNGPMSGKAIALSSIQSNATAKPYLTNYLQYLTQIFQIYLDIFPKYYATERTIPVVDKEGKRSFVTINSKNGGPQIKFNQGQLKVNVEAGPSFAIQKSMAIQQMTQLATAMPIFGEFLQAKGLPIVLDNLELRGVDRLQDMAPEFLQELEQQKQMQMQQAQQAMQNNPAMLQAQNERFKIEQDSKLGEMKIQIEAAKVAVEEMKVENEKLKALATIDQSQAKLEAAEVRANATEMRADVDLIMDMTELRHRHAKEAKQLDHTIEMSKKSNDKSVE